MGSWRRASSALKCYHAFITNILCLRLFRVQPRTAAPRWLITSSAPACRRVPGQSLLDWCLPRKTVCPLSAGKRDIYFTQVSSPTCVPLEWGWVRVQLSAQWCWGFQRESAPVASPPQTAGRTFPLSWGSVWDFQTDVLVWVSFSTFAVWQDWRQTVPCRMELLMDTEAQPARVPTGSAWLCWHQTPVTAVAGDSSQIKDLQMESAFLGFKKITISSCGFEPVRLPRKGLCFPYLADWPAAVTELGPRQRRAHFLVISF